VIISPDGSDDGGYSLAADAGAGDDDGDLGTLNTIVAC